VSVVCSVMGLLKGFDLHPIIALIVALYSFLPSIRDEGAWPFVFLLSVFWMVIVIWRWRESRSAAQSASAADRKDEQGHSRL